ncbi:MAG: AhpC/TSA family protein [Bryobacterales bacterium]|nr:AhpC/TSA family protein [Bryobacterales bacterium]
MRCFIQSLMISALFLAAAAPSIRAAPPSVGEKAPDFALRTLHGKTVRLSELTSRGRVVLIVLRGYPGYQCPFCNRQAQDFLRNSKAFAQSGAHVVMVYPGPPQNLQRLAKDFVAGKTLPDHFDLLLDPGYEFTNLYGVRWDSPGETAYPSTFLIDRGGIVFFVRVSKEHGGRTTAAEILRRLSKQEGSRR